MRQKIFLFLVFFGFFSLFFFGCKAQEEQIDYNLEYSKECSLKNCDVPIPTLRKPDNDKYLSKKAIYLTGLTWNDTKISVYIDGVYQGEANINTDKSGIGNFYFKVNENLEAGSHKWSAVAWTLNNWGRSYVSKENTFEILIPKNKVIDLSSQDTLTLESTSSTTNNLSEESVISSIKEKSENEVVIISNENNKKVIVEKSENPDVSITVNKSEEKKLVVDDTSSKMTSSKVSEEKKSDNENMEEKNSITENLQKASLNESLKDKIKQELDFSDKTAKNRMIGIGLLVLIIIISSISALIKRKKE